VGRGFDRLVAEAEAVPISGWDFSWLDGRATEARPSWGYRGLVARRLATVAAALDLETGGGELLAHMGALPRLMVATEAWPPNVIVAKNRLRLLGAHVVQAGVGHALPFASKTFDLVISRHGLGGRSHSAEARQYWAEVVRVLRPAGSFVSQQVGGKTMEELRDALGRPTPARPHWGPAMAREVMERAGFEITDMREEFPRTEFFDVGAIVYYLRLVVWIVPDFSVDRYRSGLLRLHDHIEETGSFVTHAHRFLVDARPRTP
jgi:SAM-dependent methyltransferase